MIEYISIAIATHVEYCEEHCRFFHRPRVKPPWAICTAFLSSLEYSDIGWGGIPQTKDGKWPRLELCKKAARS